MTLTPEAKEKIKEMMQMCYAFVLHQMPEILTKGEAKQTFDIEMEAPADMLYKECKLRTIEVGKVQLNLTFFAPERKIALLLPPGLARPRGVPKSPDATPAPAAKPEPPDPED